MNHNSRGRKILELLKSSENDSTTEPNHTNSKDVENEEDIGDDLSFAEDDDDSDQDKNYEPPSSEMDSSDDFPVFNGIQNEMNIPVWGWGGLTVILCISTFGLINCIIFVISLLLFFIGGITLMYVKHDRVMEEMLMFTGSDETISFGLCKVVELMRQPPPKLKTDRRLTGSQVIDEQLQDILSFIIRDYIYPWYDQLSANPEFPHQVQLTAQKMLISFANRVKEVDWIPYLTTRLVDDAASHLRLYRQACAKIKQINRPPSSGEGHRRVPSGSGGEHRRVPSGGKLDHKPLPDLETFFFDLELTMEENQLCRDHICLEPEKEKCFLQEITEVLLFLLAAEEDFHCRSLRFLIRELLVSTVLIPLIDMVSDPDYINQIIIWLCRDISVTSEVFLTVLRVTDNLNELNATRDLLNKEIATLRSRDSGGDDDAWVKQQLSSLIYVGKVIDGRINRIQDGADNDSSDIPSVDYSHLLTAGNKLFALPLDVILKNNVALSYFIDYMTSISAQAYLFFYLNVEGWRVSAEQQISDLALQRIKSDEVIEKGLDAAKMVDEQINNEQTLERMREAAYSIFEQYLSEKASSCLRLDESLIKRLLLRIRTETPTETWFDEIQSAVYDKLQNEDRFLNGFRNNVAYVKLLAELELLKEPGSRSDDDDTGSLDEMSFGSETASLSSLPLDTSKDASQECDSPSAGIVINSSVSPAVSPHVEGKEYKNGNYSIQAEIIETGVVNEKGKTFGIYALSVTKKYTTGHQENWHIYRRYSDFYELHQKVRERFVDLGKLTFPAKKTFHNMERRVLERRMKMLNEYLKTILQGSVITSHSNLQSLLLSFLEPGDYDRGVGTGQIAKTLDTLLVNPLRAVGQTMGQTVRTLPDNLISTVDGVMDGLSKVLQYGGVKGPIREDSYDCEAIKVGASLDAEADDNIPLRIMLLLMTEVFELKSRNQWLRRRIVTLLRQIVRTMFGDIVNRRIVDYVFVMTSPHQVADYLRSFKHAYWPHGLKAETKLPRDESIRARTRVAAKIALLSSLSDEFKHILGSETSRRGLLSVFSLFQHKVLNRRLVYVLLEGVLCTLFCQDHPLDTIFTKLHSRSPRVVKNNLQRTRR